MTETDLIANSLGGLPYGGMFIVAFLSNIFLPVPEEVILLATGYLTGIGIFSYPLMVGIFVAGMLISDYFLYSLSYKGSKLVKRLHKKLEQKGLLKDEKYLRSHIKKTIFFSRFLIYLRFIGPVVAGYLKTDKKTFLTYDFLALVIYVNIFLGLGNYFHKQIRFITDGVARFKNYLEILLIAIITVLVLKFIQKNFLKWMKKAREYMPTIIPGLEIKDKDN